ncbi:MAG: hypothetical protein AAFZ38_07255 [Myxococcota bacterium]
MIANSLNLLIVAAPFLAPELPDYADWVILETRMVETAVSMGCLAYFPNPSFELSTSSGAVKARHFSEERSASARPPIQVRLGPSKESVDFARRVSQKLPVSKGAAATAVDEVRAWRGNKSFATVDSGLLVGVDTGEFGGALWWFDRPGADPKLLGTGDPIADVVADSNTSAWIVSGLAHMSLEEGFILRGSLTEGEWSLRRVANFKSEAPARALVDDGLVFVTESVALGKLDESGHYDQLFDANAHGAYPASIVRVAREHYLVGMRGLVLDINLQGRTPVRKWLAPSRGEFIRYGLLCPKLKAYWADRYPEAGHPPAAAIR